jgi:hypothetical protein
MRHLASSQVNPPAPQPEPPMVAAAARLLSALADVSQLAQACGLEVPRELLASTGIWALRLRCLGPCVNCGEPAIGPASGLQLCPRCAPLLRPASSRREAS